MITIITAVVLLGRNSWSHWSGKKFGDVGAVSNYRSSSRQHCSWRCWHFKDGTLSTKIENCYTASGKSNRYYRVCDLMMAINMMAKFWFLQLWTLFAFITSAMN